jgi:hypothetical protein
MISQLEARQINGRKRSEAFERLTNIRILNFCSSMATISYFEL